MLRNPRHPALFRPIAASRGGRATLGLLALAGVVCAFVPLADHVGFEFALVLTVVGALVAPGAGMAGVRIGRSSPVQGALTAILVSLSALIVPILVILLNGLRRPSCEPWANASFTWLLLLPVPTLVLATAAGAFAKARTRSTLQAVLVLAGLYLASLAPGLWLLWDGPGFFLFDHVFGYFPGPLYDEVVVLSSAVWAWRALSVGWAVVLVLSVGRRRRGALVGAGLGLCLFAVEAGFGTTLGLRSTDASVARALGGTERIDDLEIHYPAEWRPDRVAAFAQDAAFRAFQVRRALGLDEGPVVRVWVYRNTEEKRRLTGAARTSFAKPWRQEVHIHDLGTPHPVLRHELVHAYAGRLPPGPWGVPGGLVPNNPLIEGLAVAFDTEPEELTLAESAKAMRTLGLAPDVGALLSSASFLTAAPARAYTQAGAFIRYLEETNGRDAVLALYRTGKLSALGTPQKLIEGYDAWLDAVILSPDGEAAALRRYRRPSVFRRTCAREVSALTDRAASLASSGRLKEAMRTWESACALEPDDPGLIRGMLTVAVQADDRPALSTLTERLLAHPKSDDSLRASVLIELGDDAWRRNDLAEAREKFLAAASLVVPQATHRNAVAKARAVASPERAALLAPLLNKGDSGLETLFSLDAHLRNTPDDSLVAYLLGRQFVQRDAKERGLSLLERTQGKLDDELLERETRRLIVETAARNGDCARAQEALSSVREQADRARGADWVERCEFMRARGWSAG